MATNQVRSEQLKTTVAFHAYRNAAWSVTNAPAQVVLDTESFDEGGNFNTTSGHFVCPVDGFYLVNAAGATDASTRRVLAFIYVNGSVRLRGNSGVATFGSATVGGTVKCAASDLIQFYFQSDATDAGEVGAEITYMNGHLVGRY